MKGLSLAETVFSTLLVMLVTLTVLTAFPTSMSAVAQGENRVQADQLALSALDTARARPFPDLQFGSAQLPAQTKGAVEFQQTLEVFTVPDEDPDLLKGLRATVWWSERGGRREVVHEVWVAGLP